MKTVRHARVNIALHELSGASGPSLLLLHALGGSSADWGELPAAWPGRVFAVDFSGHGQSAWARGAVYYPELLAGDADAALAEIGPAAIAGAGVGAYVALLLAGGRRDVVPAALLLPGRGLNGGGELPDWDRPTLQFFDTTASAPLPSGCDPQLCMLEWDTRPVDYASRFAAVARQLLLLEDGTERPPWWRAAGEAAGARSVHGDVPDALRLLRAASSADRE
jgi:pimeloyl-ACP methyl ester carboxylesterase